MSVAVLTGMSTLTDPALSYNYTRSAPVTRTLPSRPALPAAATQTSFTRPDRKSYIIPAADVQPTTTAVATHHHSRTISSSTLPSDSLRNLPLQSTNRPVATPSRPSITHSRQSSTSTTFNMMQRQGTTGSTTSMPRRSTSSRSTATNSPTSYVALMRKQKATVWCDRAQSTDPRIAAAQKQAKQRAHQAVTGSGGTGAGRTSTISSGGVVGKITHRGVPKASTYVPANISGVGVPMRLSANEMMGDEQPGLGMGENSMIHARTGSGKSSTNSAKYRSGYPRPDQGRFSSASTPPSGNEADSPNRGGIPEVSEDSDFSTSVKREYSNYERKVSKDGEDSFGELKDMSGPTAVHQALIQAKKAEDLRRRGSVDERAMSMGNTVRLFVANPDLDD